MTLPTNITPRPEVDLPHHRIHEGNHFTINEIITALGGAKNFLLITPPRALTATVVVHFIFDVTSDLGVQAELFEDSIVALSGTPLTPINHNRNSATTPLLQVFEDPTIILDGTKIFEDRIGTATSGGDVGNFNRDEQEFDLKIETNYIIRITPLFGPINITVELNWYDARPSSPVSP